MYVIHAVLIDTPLFDLPQLKTNVHDCIVYRNKYTIECCNIQERRGSEDRKIEYTFPQ